MEDELIEELKNKYCGRTVCAEYADEAYIEDEEILVVRCDEDESGDNAEDYDDSYGLSIAMGINIELDDGVISDIDISFRTFADGDSGVGEEDPDMYFEYEDCLAAAADFIRDCLDQ